MDSTKQNYQNQNDDKSVKFLHGFFSRFQFIWILLFSLGITLIFTLALYFTSSTSSTLLDVTMQMCNNSLRVAVVASLSASFHQYF